MNLNMGLLGRKIGMTQIYDEDGTAEPVTAIDAGPCTVLQIRAEEKEGYSALQLGFDPKPGRNVPEELLKRAQGARARYDLEHGRTSKPMRGHFFKVGEIAPQRFVREIRVSPEKAAEFEAGQQVTTEAFEKGNVVDVVGTSKGRGFTGVIKRHGFSMFPKTHGTHEWRRHGGARSSGRPRQVTLVVPTTCWLTKATRSATSSAISR